MLGGVWLDTIEELRVDAPEELWLDVAGEELRLDEKSEELGLDGPEELNVEEADGTELDVALLAAEESEVADELWAAAEVLEDDAEL